MNAVQLFKVLEVGFHQREGSHGAGEYHRAGITALAGENGHSADGLQNQIHSAGSQIGSGGVFCQIAEVCGSQRGVQCGGGVAGDVSDTQVDLAQTALFGQFLNLSITLCTDQLPAKTAEGTAADAAAAQMAYVSVTTTASF